VTGHRTDRRTFLLGLGAVSAAAVTGSSARTVGGLRAATQAADAQTVLSSLANPDPGPALAALGRSTLRTPGSRPFPQLPAGTDTMPEIEHIVVLVMENHSYDNVLGLLPPDRAGGRLDGATVDEALVTAWNPDGVAATNPVGNGLVQRAFRMPGTTQLPHQPTQEWQASHEQYDGGSNQGFVTSPSGPVAMGYYDASQLPFTYDLATTFPVGDRWFCSVLGQTDPNRRYIIAGTSAGMTDDLVLPTSVGSAEQLLTLNPAVQDALLVLPANGTIFDLLTRFGISWCDYTASYPAGTTAELYPVDDLLPTASHHAPVDQFFQDCGRGTLPSFSFIDENFSTQSQENPQDMVVGEAFMAQVVRAVLTSPAWLQTLLVITYDEHGGYYDHVPPPVALAPDAIAPVVAIGESAYDGFHRYGFRVPNVVVSPYAVPGGATHVLHDHTSILAMVERKWNLPALTFRDANANDLTDFLDMGAMARRAPTFEDGVAVATQLAAPGRSVPLGPVPPAGSQQPAPRS
jgi:phospholipase C